MEEEESTVDLDYQLLHLMEMFSSDFSPQNSQFSFCRFVLGKGERQEMLMYNKGAQFYVEICVRAVINQKRAVKTIREIE